MTVTTAWRIRIAPANEVPWDDLQAILTGTAARCQCTRQRLGDREWYALPVEQRGQVLRDAVACDDRAVPDDMLRRDPARTAGIVAYVDDEPAGWAALDARSAYRRLRGSPVPWPAAPSSPTTPACGRSRAWWCAAATAVAASRTPSSRPPSTTPASVAPAPSRATRC